MSDKKEDKNNDSILRVSAMLASVAVVIAGGIFDLEFQIQALAMGFLLVIASGTDPLKLVDRWKERK